MGRSATAMLFWGSPIESYSEDEDHNLIDLQPEWWYKDHDWKGYIARELPNPWDGLSDAEWEQRKDTEEWKKITQDYFDKKEALVAPFKCDLDSAGHCDGETYYFVHHKELLINADYYELGKINLVELVEGQVANNHEYLHDLEEFLESTGLTIQEPPGWRLTAYYG